DEQPLLQKDANAAQTYLPGGRAPRAGEIFKNPDLAKSLEEIARRGRDGYYKGESAKKIVALSQKLGGAMAADDLADFSAEWVEPISTTYHGWEVYEMPPNGQGIAALEMLNLMEQFPLKKFGAGSADALHVMIEAKKLAYADLFRYIGDPRFAKIPVAGLLSKEYAEERAKQIDMGHANCDVPPGDPPGFAGDTTYLTVVDREGNMVSLIQSNFSGFGSGLVTDGTGFVLQNRGTLFRLDAKSPDVLAGRKRPLHTIIPAFMTRGEEKISFGIMGGFNQAQAHAQFVSDIADYGMNIQAALEFPRFSKQTFKGCDVPIEKRVAPEVRAALTARGHEVEVHGDFSGYMGGGQAVRRDFATGVNYGASDPRKDGEAIPEGLPEGPR
ncbi:MAG: gamma-glutamyltransferase family protein, partial [Acidobacteriaceae bacterium]